MNRDQYTLPVRCLGSNAHTSGCVAKVVKRTAAKLGVFGSRIRAVHSGSKVRGLLVVMALATAACVGAHTVPTGNGASTTGASGSAGSERLDERTPAGLLARSVKAHGGAEAVLEFKDLEYRTELAIRSEDDWYTGEALIRVAPPDRAYSAFRIHGGGERIVYADGVDRGEWPSTRTPPQHVDRDIERRLRLSRIHAFFTEAPEGEVTLDEPEREGELRCAVLTRKAGDETWRIWIDLERFLLRKVRLLLPAGDPGMGGRGPSTVEWRYERFESIDGRVVPRNFDIHINGEVRQRGRVVSYALNPGLDPELFRPPEMRSSDSP